MGLKKTSQQIYRADWFLFFIFFFVKEAFGQRRLPADSTIWYIGSQAHYGFIIAHRDAIRPLVNDTNPWGLSLELSRLRYTQSAWNACNCYSQNGLALTYFNFDNPQVLGRVLIWLHLPNLI